MQIIQENGENTEKRFRPQQNYVSNSKEQKGSAGRNETPNVTKFFTRKAEFPI